MYNNYSLLEDTFCFAITRTSDVHCFSSFDLNVLLPLRHIIFDLIKVNTSFLLIQDIVIE